MSGSALLFAAAGGGGAAVTVVDAEGGGAVVADCVDGVAVVVVVTVGSGAVALEIGFVAAVLGLLIVELLSGSAGGAFVLVVVVESDGTVLAGTVVALVDV